MDGTLIRQPREGKFYRNMRNDAGRESCMGVLEMSPPRSWCFLVLTTLMVSVAMMYLRLDQASGELFVDDKPADMPNVRRLAEFISDNDLSSILDSQRVPNVRSSSPTRRPSTGRPSKRPKVYSAKPSRRPSFNKKRPTSFPSKRPLTAFPSKRPTPQRTRRPSTGAPSKRSNRTKPPTKQPTRRPTTFKPTPPSFSPTSQSPSLSPSSTPPTLNPTSKIPTRAPILTQRPTRTSRAGLILNLNSAGFVYAADPNALVVNDTLYLFCSTDPPNAGISTKYNSMRAYSLLTTTSVEDNVPWINHGIVLRPASQFPNIELYRKNPLMFAPGAAYADGWFFLYFPFLRVADGSSSIGIAKTMDPRNPNGWILVQPIMPNLNLFDPAVMIDLDGAAYLYGNSRDRKDGGAAKKLLGGRLKSNLVELESPVRRLYGGTVTEAVFVFNRMFPDPSTGRNTIKYYIIARLLTGNRDCLMYWMADAPLPWIPPTNQGVRLTANQYDAPAHASIVQFRSKWYIFYHTGVMNNGNRWRRSTCMNEIGFAPDGQILTPLLLSCPVESQRTRSG